MEVRPTLYKFEWKITSFLFVNKLHKRKIKSIITSRKSVDWSRFFYAFFVWFTIGVLLIGVDYFMSPSDYVWNFKPIPFFTLLAISLFFLPLQSSTEEVLFRGYFNKQQKPDAQR